MGAFPFKQTSAFVLHSRSYRETSIIAEFFTKDFGRVAAVIRGARKAHSKISGLLLPFVPLCLSFRGKSDLLNVQTLEATGQFCALKGRALLSGLYANELLYRLLHKFDVYEALFLFYQELLAKLQFLAGDAFQQQLELRLFEKKLLREIGYGLQFDKTAFGELITESEYYSFRYGLGFVKLGQGRQRNGNSQAIKGTSILALHNENEQNCKKETLEDINFILYTVLYGLLGEKFAKHYQILNF